MAQEQIFDIDEQEPLPLGGDPEHYSSWILTLTHSFKFLTEVLFNENFYFNFFSISTKFCNISKTT